MLGIIESGQKIVGSGLVMHFDAGQIRSYTGSGAIWRDISGNNLSASLAQSWSFIPASGGYMNFTHSAAQTEAGFSHIAKSQNSALFDGLTASLTLIGWTQPVGEQIMGARMFGFGDSQPFMYEIRGGENVGGVNVGRYVGVYYQAPAGTYVNEYSALTLTGSEGWTQVGFVKSGSQVRHIKNGVTQSTALAGFTLSGNGLFLTSSNVPFTIGGYGNTSGTPSNDGRYRGNHAIVMVYNRALTNEEIKSNYDAVKSRFGKT